MSYAFISYGSKDRDIVNPIKDILVANGIKHGLLPMISRLAAIIQK